MKTKKSASIALNDFLKLWIKSKASQFYRQDPYLKYLNTDIALSHLHEGLTHAKTMQQLHAYLEESGVNRHVNITRKNDGETFFQYPSLSFHIESLLVIWPEICRLYQDQSLLDVNNRFGHRPHLASNFSDLDANAPIKLKDIKLNCPLKIPFQEDYPNFKASIINRSNEVLNNSRFKNANVLVIQSDIQKFFHSLKLGPLKVFLNANFPKLASISSDFLDRITNEFKFGALPIGWSLSGVFADLVMVRAHEAFKNELNKQLQRKLKNIDIGNYVKQFLSEIERSEETISQIENLILTSSVEFKSAINYVDDLIFILEYNISEQFKEHIVVKTFEKTITFLLLEIAEKILNSLFNLQTNLHLYRPDDEKGRHFSFDRSNIDTLNSNFFSIANNIPSDSEEPNLWTRLDEFLLPADNDLTLNERTQFFMHLANLRHKVLEGETLDDHNLNDIFQKIILKIQGPEAKYIASVLRLIEVLLITNYEKHLEFCTKALLRIYQEFQKSNKPFELWLRFFSGYFKIFQKLSFDPKFKFYDDFDQFTMFWSKNNGTEDDKDLLKAIKVSFLIKSAVGRSISNGDWLEIMDRRRQGHERAGAFSKNFLGFNISHRNSKVRIQINSDYDSFSVASFFKYASRVRPIGTDSYIHVGKKIKQKASIEAAVQFYNLSAFAVIPRWSEEEIEDFLRRLPGVTSNTHAQTIKRLLRRARNQQAAIGESYIERLQHLKIALSQNASSKMKNIPTVFGGGDLSQYRSVVFYLATLESNSLYDLKRAYLSTLIPIDSARDFSYLQVPIALRKTGLAFYRLQQRIMEFRRKDVTVGQIVSLVEEVLNDEIKRNSGNGSTLNNYKSEGTCFVDLNKLHDGFATKHVDLLLTLCPIGMSAESAFDEDRGLQFKVGVHERLDLRIESAINEAKKRGANAIVFPELTLPRRYLLRYLDMCGNKGLLLIAGAEYATDHSTNCRNSTIISFPVDPRLEPYGRSYIAFEQDKHFPAAEEKQWLERRGIFKYQAGRNLFVFSSKKYCNFAILTCSDFLSLRLRLKLQEKVQTVFVPAQNLDMTTYNHIAESSIRDLHCFAVVCNNQDIGGSFIYAPFRDRHKRTVFRKDGSTLPEFLTMKWSPSLVRKSQTADSQQPFKGNPSIEHMKQTPPDWGYD